MICNLTAELQKTQPDRLAEIECPQRRFIAEQEANGLIAVQYDKLKGKPKNIIPELKKKGFYYLFDRWHAIPPIAAHKNYFLGSYGKQTPEEKFWHFQQMVNILLAMPGCTAKFDWHEWAQWQIKEACANEYVAVWGSASSGKTRSFGLWAFMNYFIAPEETAVIVCSREKLQARKLIWADVLYFWNGVAAAGIQMPGKLIPSSCQIVTVNDNNVRNEKCGIYLVAAGLKEGAEAKNNIIGYKAPRIFLIVDEAQLCTESILDAPSNLKKGGWKQFQTVMMGNISSIFDTLGKFSTPVDDDWSIVNPDLERWNLKSGGVGIRLDGEKSENVRAGKPIWPYLITEEAMEADAIRYGGRNSSKFWQMNRGLPPPDGAENGVYSAAELIQTRAFEKRVQWREAPTPLAFLDASFTSGGDKCMAMIGLLGHTTEGKHMLLFPEDYKGLPNMVTLEEDTRSSEMRAFQICRKYKAFCEERGIMDARQAGLDSTGGGKGYADILATMWSNRILRLEFGGKASEIKDTMVGKKASELYANKVTEIWMCAKPLLRSGQIKGVNATMAKQMCSREMAKKASGAPWVDGKNRVRVESKDEMKVRVGSSPDEADAAFGVLFLARERFGFASTEKAKKDSKRDEVSSNPIDHLFDWGKPKKRKLEVYQEAIGDGGWGNM